jgi:hypothetical protein
MCWDESAPGAFSREPYELDCNRRRTANRGICEGKMFQRGLQLFVLLLVATLLCSSQCYAMCAASACVSTSSDNSHCHHSGDKSHGSGQRCQDRHSDFVAAPEKADSTKFAVPSFADAPALWYPEAGSVAEIQPPVKIAQNPADVEHQGTSVLALLSTLRV